jgi:hypothetical protein
MDIAVAIFSRWFWGLEADKDPARCCPRSLQERLSGAQRRRIPCKQVPRLHEQKRERYIAETEFQSVRALALPMMQTAMDLALLRGLRQGDLLPLEKRHLSDERIDIVTASTHKRLIIERRPDLRGVINRAFDISSRVRQFVICNRPGPSVTTRPLRRQSGRAAATQGNQLDLQAKTDPCEAAVIG